MFLVGRRLWKRERETRRGLLSHSSPCRHPFPFSFPPFLPFSVFLPSSSLLSPPCLLTSLASFSSPFHPLPLLFLLFHLFPHCSPFSFNCFHLYILPSPAFFGSYPSHLSNILLLPSFPLSYLSSPFHSPLSASPHPLSARGEKDMRIRYFCTLGEICSGVLSQGIQVCVERCAL